MFNIIVCSDYEDVSSEAFRLLKPVLRKEHPVLGVATGSSPLGLYRLMIEDHNINGRSYANVVTFNLDEYAGLPQDHPQSYHTYMQREFIQPLGMNPEHVHIPNGNAENLQAECDAYDALMKQYTIDFQILGIGTDGHIGFNEPGTMFDTRTHIADLTEQTREDNKRFFGNDINAVPRQAITMGLGNIQEARKIIVIATGKNKAKAIAGLVQEKPDVSCPASILQKHSNITVIVDKDAAGMLMI